MILGMEKARPNNEILVSMNQNCNGMIADNTNKRASHQCGVLTAIKK